MLERIKQSLNIRGIEYKEYSNYLVLRCLNPAHIDNNPSMVIYDSGRFICFGCGWRGKVSELFKEVKVPILDLEVRSRKAITDEVNKKLNSNQIIKAPLPDGKRIESPIRGFPAEFLRKFMYRSEDGLVFPIRYDGKYIGYTMKRFYDGKWIHSKSYVYGKHFSNYCYPFFAKSKIMILVEGVFDFLRLRYYYLPSFIMFGAAFNKFKAEWILRSVPEMIIICFDGDEAGRTGAEKYERFFSRHTYVTKFNLPDGTDPDIFFRDPKNITIFRNFVIKAKKSLGG